MEKVIKVFNESGYHTNTIECLPSWCSLLDDGVYRLDGNVRLEVISRWTPEDIPQAVAGINWNEMRKAIVALSETHIISAIKLFRQYCSAGDSKQPDLRQAKEYVEDLLEERRRWSGPIDDNGVPF